MIILSFLQVFLQVKFVVTSFIQLAAPFYIYVEPRWPCLSSTFVLREYCTNETYTPSTIVFNFISSHLKKTHSNSNKNGEASMYNFAKRGRKSRRILRSSTLLHWSGNTRFWSWIIQIGKLLLLRLGNRRKFPYFYSSYNRVSSCLFF